MSRDYNEIEKIQIKKQVIKALVKNDDFFNLTEIVDDIIVTQKKDD